MPIIRTLLLSGAVALVVAAPSAAATKTPAPRPNLSVSSVSDPPSQLQPGGSYTATVTLRNKGRASAKVSQLAVALSTDDRLSDADIVLATAQRALRAGRRSVLSLRVSVPAALPAGSYRILACADQLGRVKESSEKDNCRAARLTLTVRPLQSLPAPPAPAAVTVQVPAPTPPAPTPDTTGPAAPALTTSLPQGIGADASPLVVGTAEAGARVRFFLTAACTGSAVAQAVAGEDGAFSAGVPVPSDTTSAIRATATDAAGNASACSAPLSYEQDATTPDAPSITASTPASPAPEPKPTFSGTAEPSTIITVYLGVACNGAVQGQTVTDVNGAWSIALDVADNDTTSVTVTATDPAGHTSLCSTPRAYRQDDTAPAAGVLTGTTPSLTGNVASPTLAGTAEPGSDVLVYTGSSCTGPVLSTVHVGDAGTWSTTVAAAPNASRSWSAFVRDAAGNVSTACSNTVTYLHDDVVPGVPAFDSPATTPASPSPDLTPVISGTADGGSIVRLFQGTTCSGFPLTTIVADQDGLWSVEIEITSGAQNQTLTFSIQARDAASNTSACAQTTATYVHDNSAPAVSDVAWSASPGSGTTVTVTGHTEPNLQVYVFGGNPTICTNVSKAWANAAADANGDFTVNVPLRQLDFQPPLPALPPDDGEYPLGVASRDAAGNISNCEKTTYVLDRSASPPNINNPVSPGADELPTISGDAEPGASVQVFENGTCTGSPLDTVTSDGGWSVTAVTPVSGTVQYSARQTDTAGNVSDCSSPYEYTRDVTPPSTPVLADTYPATGTSVGLSPYVRGTADADAFVTIYASSDCSEGTEIGSGQGGDGFAYPGIQVFLSVPSTDLSARSTDQVGNASGCSNSITYATV